MSKKENQRRRMCYFVMKKAWLLFRKLLCMPFKACLHIDWQIIRGKCQIIRSKVRGVSYDNRQHIIRTLSATRDTDFSLHIRRDIYNTKGSNALEVVATNNWGSEYTIGYVASKLANYITPMLEKGALYFITDYNVTGIDRKREYRGLNYQLVIMNNPR